MKIAVTGYYGFSNYGDDLFIIATKLGADEYWKEHELIFISPPVKGLDANYIVPNWFPKNIYSSLNLIGKLSRMYFFILAMLRSGAILNAGGSTISSTSSFSKFKIQILMKKLFNKKIMGIGLSIGPFTSVNDEKRAKDLIQQFDILSVRDKKSCEFISNLQLNTNTSCSTDLAAIISKNHNFDKISKSKDIVGVSLMQFDNDKKDSHGNIIDVKKSMLQILEFVKNHNKLVRVFILNTHPVNGDTKISEEFIDMLKKSNIQYEKISLDIGTLEVWKKIAECSMMISYRLHGAITAYLSNVPFYLFEYHQKCTDFLNDINYEKFIHIDEDGLSLKKKDFEQYIQNYSIYIKKSGYDFQNLIINDIG